MGAFLSSRIMSDVLLGLTSGALYATVALSLVLIWRATHVLNFAQGAMSLFAAYIGITELDNHLSYWLCVLIAVVAGFLLGGVAERVLVRPLYGKPEINPIVVMVGFLIVLEAVGAAIWSSVPRSLPVPFSSIDWQLGGRPIALSRFSIFEITTAVVVMGAIVILFRFTRLGLQLRASALAPEVSRLLGVRVGRMLTLGWMLSSAVGVVTAVLVASSFFTGLTPQLLDGIFAYGFIAAAVGGLDSPVGAVISGVVLGIVLQFVEDYLNSNAPILVALGILIVSLMLRPNGLFTPSAERRV